MLNLLLCSVYGFLLFSTGLQISNVQGKSLSHVSDENAEETTPRIGKTNWNSDEDDYGLGIIFDTSELDFYGRKQSPSVEPKTELPDTATDDIEKLIVTSKAYLTCGEGEDNIGCEDNK